MLLLLLLQVVMVMLTFTAAVPVRQQPRPRSSNSDRPNFVVIFADDLGINEIQLEDMDVGYTGLNGSVSTPNLKRLADEGMVFTNWYSAFHVCSPSRASMMTGRYSIRSGIGISPAQYKPDAPGGPLPSQVFSAEAVGGLPLNETTMAEALLKRGYATMAIGKWHLGQRDLYLPTAHGFQDYFGIPFSQDMGESFWWPLGYTGHEPMEPTPLPLMSGTAVIEQPAALDAIAQRYADTASDFVLTNAERGKPFFLYLSFNHVHAPNSCSPKFCGSSSAGPIGDAIQEMDWSVGQLMDVLRHAGVDDNTLVFFTSDNGAPLANDAGGNLPLRDGKASTWEGGFKEPGIARWPGRIPSNSKSHALVSTMDIFTTVVTIAGGQVPDDRVVDGIDLSPILFNGSTQGHECIMFYHNAAAVNASGELFAMRCGKYKIHWATHSTETQPWPDGKQDPPLLFDLESDPTESHPIHSESAEYIAARAVLEAARLEHLGTIKPVPDQNARGSKTEYQLCSSPNSKGISPAWPNCTLTPQNWRPADICNSSRCLQSNPHFPARCGPHLCPGKNCPPVPGTNRIGCYKHTTDSTCHFDTVITGTCNNETKPLFVNMDVDLCNALCQGYTFFGVGEGGLGCYCSLLFPVVKGRVNDTLCNYPCLGNPLETCGGPSLDDLYIVVSVD